MVIKYYVIRSVNGRQLELEIEDYLWQAWSGCFCLLPGITPIN